MKYIFLRKQMGCLVPNPLNQKLFAHANLSRRFRSTVVAKGFGRRTSIKSKCLCNFSF